MAQSFYGVLVQTASNADVGLAEDQLVEEAFHIERTVENAVKSHTINPGNIEAEIRKSLLPHYFKLLGGLDAANALVGDVIAVVRAGSAKGRG